MVKPPSGPPPPAVPGGWKAHWNAEYKCWFYENIYTEESVWEMPKEPVYPQASSKAPPAGPPPGYQTTQAAPIDVKTADLASLPNTMASVSISDTNQYAQPQPQQPAQQPVYTSYNPSPPPAAQAQQPPPSQQLYTATPPPAAQPILPGPSAETRDYPGQPQYPPTPQYGAYPPQQPQYAPQQPAYPSQPSYSPQPQYAPRPQAQAPPQQVTSPAKGAGGFMGMLKSKVPGGATGTALGVGAGLLAGGILEHEWDEHREREKRHSGFGGMGRLMRGFGEPNVVDVTNVTVDEDVTVDQNTTVFGF